MSNGAGVRAEAAGTGEETDPAMSTAVRSSSRPQLASHARLTFDRTRERDVLLMPEAVWVLNGTGAAILGLCDGHRTVAEIMQELRGRYNSVVGDDVEHFIARLVDKGYLELSDG